MSLFRSFNPALKNLKFHSLKKSPIKAFVGVPECQLIIDKLDLKAKYPNPEKLNIVDVFSGYGLLSTMINYELKPQKHVLIDHNKAMKSHYQDITDALAQHNQPNSFVPYDANGYSWSTFTQLVKEKVIEPSIKPRDQIHDELLVVANLYYHPFDESLLAQWIMCCAYHNWLQRYGRVKMICVVPESTAQKFMSGPGFAKRNRSAIKRELWTDSKLIAITEADGDNTIPDGCNYDPNLLIKDQPIVLPLDCIHPKNPRIAVLEIDPRPDSKLDVELLDYVAQILMYRKNHSVAESLSHLAPGAYEDLAPQLTDILDKTPRDLTAEEFTYILDIFDKWPFKPSIEERNSLNPEPDDAFL